MLPASYSPTARQVRIISSALGGAGVGRVLVLDDPDGDPLEVIRPVPRSPQADRGPIEGVRVRRVEPLVRVGADGTELAVVLKIAAIRPGGDPGLLAVLGTTHRPEDPWLEAEGAAHRAVTVAGESGCVLLRASPGAEAEIRTRLAELLRPYELSGAEALAAVTSDTPLSALIQLERGLADLGVTPFVFATGADTDELPCRDPVASPEELFAVIAEQRAAAEALSPGLR